MCPQSALFLPIFLVMAGAYSKRIFLPQISSLTSLGYVVGRTIGEGSFAKVKAAWCPYNQEMIAIKILTKSESSKNHRFLMRELNIVTRLEHPLIVKTFTVMETRLHYFILQEIAENGDLMTFIRARYSLFEEEACFLFQQLCQAVAYCHGCNIAHRDLKCENVMLDRHMNVKLGDFGLAIDLNFNSASARCGTKFYVAPEIVSRENTSYDPMKSDIWSLGVVLYVMVCGTVPSFQKRSFFTNVTVIHYEHHVTRPVRELIGRMLNANPLHRPNIMELKRSLWLNSKTMIRPTPLISTPRFTPAKCLPPHQVLKTLPPLNTPPSPSCTSPGSYNNTRENTDVKTRRASIPALPQPPISQPVSTASPAVSRQPLTVTSQKHKKVGKENKFKKLKNIIQKKLLYKLL